MRYKVRRRNCLRNPSGASLENPRNDKPINALVPAPMRIMRSDLARAPFKNSLSSGCCNNRLRRFSSKLRLLTNFQGSCNAPFSIKFGLSIQDTS